MKILFITSLLGKQYGGAEVSTRLLLDKLVEQGYDVQVLTTRKIKNDPRLISINFPIEIPKKLLTLGNRMVDYFLARKIRQKLEEIKPDVIHIQDTYILPATVAANKTLKIPSIATIRNSVLDETWCMMFRRPLSSMLAWRNKIIIQSLQHVNCIISVSEYIKTELVKRGIDSQKVTTIYNLPPTLKIPSPQKRGEIDSTIHLFAPGQLETFKGFSTLIEAMKIVVETNPNVHLLIAGGGSQKQKLQKQTNRLRLCQHIEFAGKVPFIKLANLYVDCDIVLFPSIYAEPFGRVALEAMHFAKPVIASKVGGIPEVVEDKKTGLLVPPDNPAKLAEVILFLAHNASLREELGKNGRESTQTKFLAQKVLSKHIKIYDFASKVTIE